MLLNTVLTIAVVTLFGCAHGAAAVYDADQAWTSLYFAVATFCDLNSFATRDWVGPTEGFVVTKTIDHPKSKVIGYIGYLPSDNSIYIAFRGSDSVNNWISDMEVSRVNYTSFPECNCQVSKGWYNAEQSVFPEVLMEVRALQMKLPDYSVKVTGHSYGAAMSQLVSMDLIANDIPCSVYNFGQPRTGDAAYSAFAGRQEKLSTFRVVHNQDLVPHWPFNGDTMEYYHVCTEAFENADGVVSTCNDSCEDPACSDQFKPHQWRPEQHMTYLGMYIACENVSR